MNVEEDEGHVDVFQFKTFIQDVAFSNTLPGEHETHIVVFFRNDNISLTKSHDPYLRQALKSRSRDTSSPVVIALYHSCFKAGKCHVTNANLGRRRQRLSVSLMNVSNSRCTNKLPYLFFGNIADRSSSK